MPNKWLAPLPPVICNAVLIGAMIAWYLTGFSAQFPALFAYNAVTVGIGEAVACYVLGLLLLTILPRIPALRGDVYKRQGHDLLHIPHIRRHIAAGADHALLGVGQVE